ncbi:MAG: AAA family ATPase [Methylococcales bacterium]|jgi:5-methylcytosine-specific restriction protein B|nr:AAA family ATPase [Methylococcales bacterium]
MSYDEVLNFLDIMFGNETPNRQNAQKLIDFIYQNFEKDIQFYKTTVPDLRASSILDGRTFFVIANNFRIIVCLQDNPEPTLFTINGNDRIIASDKALSLIENDVDKLKRYIVDSYECRAISPISPPPPITLTLTPMKNQSLNTILFGPPGTGKTYTTIEKALEIIDSKFLNEKIDNRSELKTSFDAFVMKGRIRFVTFHQSFSYEEFVEGIRASTEDGQIRYAVQDGIFKEMCKNASDKSEDNYVLIIDEINRGNISKIFGELITLVEDSKRAGNDEALSVILPYSKKNFEIPNNLHLIGTMNTADRSLSLIDLALRRRFNFIEMPPRPDLLRDILVNGINIEKMLTVMNKRITILYDREHTLGHAFFMPLKKSSTIEKLAEIFENKIIPLLQEYFYDDWRKVRVVLGDDRRNKKVQFFSEKSEIENDLFEDETVAENAIFFELNLPAFKNVDAYKGIYE